VVRVIAGIVRHAGWGQVPAWMDEAIDFSSRELLPADVEGAKLGEEL
jgi:hypothetical protein